MHAPTLQIPELLIEFFQNLIQVYDPPSKIGRPRKNTKQILTAIIYQLDNNCKWCALPKEFGNKNSIHAYYQRWSQLGILQKFFKIMLKNACYAGILDTSKVCLDATIIRSPGVREEYGKDATNRGRRGTKVNLLCDAQGLPLNIIIGGANHHDSYFFDEIIDSLSYFIKNNLKNSVFLADKAYNSSKIERKIEEMGMICDVPLKKNSVRGLDRGKIKGRWVVERCFSWFKSNRSVNLRFARKKETFDGGVFLIFALILYENLYKCRVCQY